MCSNMEPVKVLSRVLDLVETWNIESPFTKSINRVMQNQIWNNYSHTNPWMINQPMADNINSQTQMHNLNWSDYSSIGQNSFSNHVTSIPTYNQYNKLDNKTKNAPLNYPSNVNNIFNTSNVKRRLSYGSYSNLIKNEPEMDRSNLNKLKSEFRSLTDQFHDNSTVPVLLPATANEMSAIPNAKIKSKVSIFDLFDVTQEIVKRSPPPTVIRPMISRTDENSCIQPQLIIVKSNKSVTKTQTCDNVEECMRLFNLVTDHNVVGCDGDTNRILDLSLTLKI